jgi:hypothetical protein
MAGRLYDDSQFGGDAMSTSIFEIRDTSGDPISSIEASVTSSGITTLQTIRVELIDNTGAARDWDSRTAGLGVVSIDGLPKTAGVDRGIAGDCVDGQWIEAKIGTGAWTPIGGHLLDAGAATIAITDPAPTYHVDIELRINVPTTASYGQFAVRPYAFYY